jgi:predicted transcriptional regulator
VAEERAVDRDDEYVQGFICQPHHITWRLAVEARLYREFFRALSNQTRFSIVQLLREKPHYVNEMVEKLGIEQSRISHNLACLLNCGFVEWEWNGKNKV